MVYYFLRFFARIIYRLIYRKMYVYGKEHVPKNASVIMCCNHPSGFIEPIAMAVIFDRPFYYLVRGDLFKGWLKWILIQTNQIPIFRFRDGFSGLRHNDKSINQCEQIVLQNNTLLVYPEGGTEQMWHLRPLQKGAFRIAFGCVASDPDHPIYIQPAGIHLTRMNTLRGDMYLSFGEPILINDYWGEYKENPNATMRKLIAMLYPVMKEQMVHLDNIANEDLLRRYIYAHARKNGKGQNVTLQEWQSAANTINTMSDESKKTWCSNLHSEQYLSQNFPRPPVLFWQKLVKDLVLVLGFPVFLLGAISCYPIVEYVRRWAKRKAPKKVFTISVMMVGYVIAFAIFVMIAPLILWCLFGNAAFWYFVLPLSGLFALWYWEWGSRKK